jgi:hypothetical protein
MTITVEIMPSAGIVPAYQRSSTMMEWFMSIDDLIRFVYGNQGRLFAEAAQLFKGWREGEFLIAAEGTRSQRLRILGSWEDR